MITPYLLRYGAQTVDKPTHHKNADRVYLDFFLQMNNPKYSQSLKMALRMHFCLLRVFLNVCCLSVVHFVCISACVYHFVLSEEKRYAPYSRKCYYYIQDSAYNTCTSTECPGYYIKLEQTYKSPVESANKQYEKSYLVKHNYRYRPSVKRECVDFISHTHSFSIVTAKKSIILV